MSRKPRSDAVLKTLPPKRQQQIVDYALGHSLADTVEWLRADGLKTSNAALSEFCSWYQLRQRLDQMGSTVETLVENLRRRQPGLSPEELFGIGQTLFGALAIQSHDPKTWLGTQRLALKQREIQLDERRIRLLEQKAAQADQAEEVAKSDLTPEQKAARFKEIFGIS